MIKTLLVSLVTSFVSLAIVLLFPVNYSVSGEEIGPSPYIDEIREIIASGRKGFHPGAQELKRLEELKIKNREWFDKRNKGGKMANEILGWSELKEKSSYMGAFFGILWFFSSYFFAKKNCSSLLVVLVFPTVLYVSGLFSLVALLFIFAGVAASFFYLTLVKKHNK